MKILIICNKLTKCYEGDYEPEKLAAFIKQEFDFAPEEYSIFESSPIEVKEGKTYRSISEIKAEPITKIIELKIQPGNISDELPPILKTIFCLEVTKTEEYMSLGDERLFKLASLRP